MRMTFVTCLCALGALVLPGTRAEAQGLGATRSHGSVRCSPPTSRIV